MRFNYDAIVLGASAGGIAVLREIIDVIPAGYPLPIIIVQHMYRNINLDISMTFNNNMGLIVKEAAEKEPLLPGTLYVAPAGYHLLVERNHTLSLSVDPVVNYSRPSIDVLFETAAAAYGKRLVGVILTGANNDGAHGLKTIKDFGGLTVVQDPDSAEVRTMPEAALHAARPDHVLSAAGIGRLLASLGEGVPH